MACDVLLIVTMIVFLLKYRKTMQVMLTAFLQMNTKNTSIQSVQADQIGRTYPLLFTLNLPKEEEIIDDLREITTMEYVVQVIIVTSIAFESKDDPTQMTKIVIYNYILYYIQKTIHSKLICTNVHS